MTSYKTSALSNNFKGKEIKEIQGGQSESSMEITFTDGSCLKVGVGISYSVPLCAWLVVEQVGL